MGRRLGWGGGMLAGGLMLGDALLTETPADALARIWRDDPSLNQYQPSLKLTSEGAFLSLSGNVLNSSRKPIANAANLAKGAARTSFGYVAGEELSTRSATEPDLWKRRLLRRLLSCVGSR